MYTQFYGFSERPFSLLPDPDFLFFSEQHQAALSVLEMAVANNSGFCVLSGEIGTGKTTLLRELLNRLDDSINVGLVSNTHPSFGDLIQWILSAYGLIPVSGNSIERQQQFFDFVISEHAKNKRTLLIIDEAQQLSPAAMEDLRMLSNINADKQYILQIILAGQHELRTKLQNPGLRQFAQRISSDYHLEYLDREDTYNYIRHRLQRAGGSPDLFDISASHAVYESTGGAPRLINKLCDLCLVYGYTEKSRSICAATVYSVIEDKQNDEFTNSIPMNEIKKQEGSSDVSSEYDFYSSEIDSDITKPDPGTEQLTISFKGMDSGVKAADIDNMVERDVLKTVKEEKHRPSPGVQKNNDAYLIDDEVMADYATSASQKPIQSDEHYRSAFLPLILIAIFVAVSVFSVMEITNQTPEYIVTHKQKIKDFVINKYESIAQAGNVSVEKTSGVFNKPIATPSNIDLSEADVKFEKHDLPIPVTEQGNAAVSMSNETITDQSQLTQKEDLEEQDASVQLLRNTIESAVAIDEEQSSTTSDISTIEEEAKTVTVIDDASQILETEKTMQSVTSKITEPAELELLPAKQSISSGLETSDNVETANTEVVLKPKNPYKARRKVKPATTDSVAAKRAAARAALERDRLKRESAAVRQ